jgi:hypothetical protein
VSAVKQSIGDDLAFMRALAEGGGESRRATAAGFVAGGVLYGLQCFVQGADAVGWLRLSDMQSGIFVAAITIGFLLLLGWILWRYRNAPSTGVSARALAAAFSGAGTATLALLCVFASAALREGSITIWMLFPCAVFALQGAAWMVAWSLRRRGWLGLVALGWMASAIGLSLAIGHDIYPFIAGAALLLFMAVPGAVMMRSAQR